MGLAGSSGRSGVPSGRAPGRSGTGPVHAKPCSIGCIGTRRPPDFASGWPQIPPQVTTTSAGIVWGASLPAPVSPASSTTTPVTRSSPVSTSVTRVSPRTRAPPASARRAWNSTARAEWTAASVGEWSAPRMRSVFSPGHSSATRSGPTSSAGTPQARAKPRRRFNSVSWVSVVAISSPPTRSMSGAPSSSSPSSLSRVRWASRLITLEGLVWKTKPGACEEDPPVA